MTIASRHNGGRSQVNPYFPWYTAQMSFVNVAKHGSSFANKSDNFVVEPSVLDAQGYPTSGSYYAGCSVSNEPSILSASWTMSWNGNGQVDIPGTIQTVGPGTTQVNSFRASSGNSGGSVTFIPTSRSFSYGAHSTAASPNHVRDIKIYLTSEASRVAAGAYFGSKFLARMIEANFGVIRFLDWQAGNTSNVTTWAMRKPVDYATWSSTEFRASIYCGSTTNSGNAYSITGNGLDVPASGAPTHGMTLTLKFNASGTGAATLSLNGTTAVPILGPYCGPVSDFAVHLPAAGFHATLVYDSLLNAWLKHGGDTEGFSQGIDNMVPIEVMLQLCAEIGAHPYFVSHHLTLDTPTDYMPGMMAYVRDNAPSWMIPRFEGPNEIFNTFAGFQCTPYANARATAYGWGADYHNWYGRILSILGQMAATVYGVAQANVKTQQKYQIICGVQTVFAGDSAFNPRMTSAKYVLQTPPSPYLASAASNWTTHMCCAQYMAPSAYGTATETTLSSAFLGVRFKASASGGTLAVSSIDTLVGSFTGSASGGVLTVTGSTGSPIAVGCFITPGSGTSSFSSDMRVTSFGTGTGGDGTYNVTSSQTVSGAMNASAILAIGKTIFGRGVGNGTLSSGIAITGGSAPNWTISDSTLSLAAGSSIYAGTDMTAPATYGDTLTSGTSDFNLANLNVIYRGWQTWAVTYSIKICGYEGGYSTDYTGASSAAVNILRYAAKITPAMKTYLRNNYKSFLTVGGEYPSMYHLGSDYPSSTVWGVLEDLYQTPDPPQWEAVKEFNAAIGTLTVKI